MAFYAIDRTLPHQLAEGLDELRSARYKLANELGHMNQMLTDLDFADRYGIPLASAAAAKAELQADIGKLLSSDAGINMSQTQAAVVQMLNQFA